MTAALALAAALAGPPRALVAELGHPSFPRREAAGRAARGLDVPAGLALFRRARADHPDAEVRARAGRLYGYYREAALREMEPFPPVRCVAGEGCGWDSWYRTRHAGLIQGYLVRLGATDGRWETTPPRDDAVYRAATRLLVGDWLDQGHAPADCRDWLDEMRRRGRVYAGAP